MKDRAEAISYTTDRIKKKLADLPNDPRVPRWNARLKEFDDALEIHSLQGRIDEIKNAGNVVINVPAGGIKVEGQ